MGYCLYTLSHFCNKIALTALGRKCYDLLSITCPFLYQDESWLLNLKASEGDFLQMEVPPASTNLLSYNSL